MCYAKLAEEALVLRRELGLGRTLALNSNPSPNPNPNQAPVLRRSDLVAEANRWAKLGLSLSLSLSLTLILTLTLP